MELKVSPVVFMQVSSKCQNSVASCSAVELAKVGTHKNVGNFIVLLLLIATQLHHCLACILFGS